MCCARFPEGLKVCPEGLEIRHEVDPVVGRVFVLNPVVRVCWSFP